MTILNLSTLLLLCLLSLSRTTHQSRLLESSPVSPEEKQQLQRIISLAELDEKSESSQEGDLVSLVENFVQKVDEEKRETNEIKKEEGEIEVEKGNGDSPADDMFTSEDSPFVSSDSVSQDEQNLIDSVLLQSKSLNSDSLDNLEPKQQVSAVQATENTTETEDAQRDSAEMEIVAEESSEKSEESEDESEVDEEVYLQSADASDNMIDEIRIPSEDELVNIDESKDAQTNTHKVEPVVAFPTAMASESILEKIKMANMKINYPRSSKTLNIKKMVKLILAKIKKKYLKIFHDWVCTLSISPGSMKKLEHKMAQHLSHVLKSAYKCLMRPETIKKIRKIMDHLFKECISCPDQQECVSKAKQKIMSILKKSSWNIVKKIWNTSLGGSVKQHAMVIPALGNNFDKKKLMDATWALGRNPNTVWWRKFGKNRDIAARNFWRSHDSHARAYDASNAYFDWYNRRPWNYQMHGWGNQMYSPFSHSMGWMKHGRVGNFFARPVVYNNYVLRNQINVPEGSQAKIAPQTFVGNNSFNYCQSNKC